MSKRLGAHVEPDGGENGAPLEVTVYAREYGWEVNFENTQLGIVRIYDFSGKQVDSAFFNDGDNMRLTLNIADWGLTQDIVNDVVRDLALD